jgi:hypothetical protein
MDDALRVRVRERMRHVAQDADRGGEWHRTLAHPLPQRLAAHVRHRVVGKSVRRRAGTQQRHDVRLLQRGGESDLAREALGAQVLRQLGGQHLDDHVALEGGIAREEHPRHAPPCSSRSSV